MAKPLELPSTKTSTELFASAVPMKCNCVADVMWSPTAPVSGLIPVTTGADGAAVSVTVMVETDGVEVTPARSVAPKEKVLAPVVISGDVMLEYWMFSIILCALALVKVVEP